MNFRVATKVAIPLCLALVSGVAGAACTPVVGVVKLTSDKLSKVVGESPVKAGFTGDCYSVQLRLAGFPAAAGHAGLTSEPVVSMIPGGGAAATPAFVPQAGQPGRTAPGDPDRAHGDDPRPARARHDALHRRRHRDADGADRRRPGAGRRDRADA